MLKAVEEITSTRKRLSVEVPAEEIEAEIQKSLKEVQRRSRLPGFRQGKAPLNLIEKKFGRDVEAEALERIVPDAYLKAVKEAEVRPVAGPVVEEKFDFKRGEPLAIIFMVEVRPIVDPLIYEGFNVRDVPVEVTDDEVESLIGKVAEERAAYEPVTDRILKGDLVVLDYLAQDSDSGAKDVVMKVGSGPFPEEFHEGLIGRSRDEEFEIETMFPEDAKVPFAGKRQRLHVKIRDVKRRSALTVDDEFAKDLGYEDMQALRERVRERAISTKKREAVASQQSELLEKIVAKHAFEVPETLLNSEIEAAIAQIRAFSKDDNKSDDLIREEVTSKAERNVRASLLLDMIGEKEGITLADEEVKEEILTMSQRVNLSPDDIMKYYIARDGSLERLRHGFFEKKVLQLLLSKATVEKGESS